MNDKSYVSMEQAVCPVCGKTFDTGSILLDRRLRNSMERHTVTHIELCPDDQQKSDDGYVALVEVSNVTHTERLKPEDAVRTGSICHIKKEVASQIFNVPVVEFPFVYVDMDVIPKIESMVQPE